MVRRIPGIMLACCAALIVVVALAVSGLRLALPHLDRFRPFIIEQLNTAFDAGISIRTMQGKWQSFGPALDVSGITATTADEHLQIQRMTVALDVWQSLLHWRWQFRDVTFYRLQLTLNSTLLGRDHKGSPISSDGVSDLFLHQFDHFILRDSELSFLSPSGERTRLAVPQLTWLNTKQRHRAEGQISLSGLNARQGAVDLRMDLHDQKGLLDNGKVYLQADNIDLKPWFSQWLKSNTGLQSADFSLAAWLTINNGDIAAADAFLRQGSARWQALPLPAEDNSADQSGTAGKNARADESARADQSARADESAAAADNAPSAPRETGSETVHRLDVNDLALHLRKQQDGWQMDVPVLNITTDGQSWAPGALSLFWLPEKHHLFTPDRAGEIRLRARALDLQRFSPFLPLLSLATPNLRARWNDLQPHGVLAHLALDIPLNQTENSRFQADWRDLSWQQWQLLPGADHVSGSVQGTLASGQLTLALDDSTLPYSEMFRDPLQIQKARVSLDWKNDDNGLMVQGKDLDVQATSLWAKGDFNYYKPVKGAPLLSILSGLRLYDASQAWRYFPEPLMGKHLVEYLTGALKGGQVDNATLIFAGNPSQFPFKHNDGQFEVWVPLRQADYQFEPGWPHLTDLAIDLDFINDGLFMDAPQTALGKASGKNVVAAIPDYSKQKLFVDADIFGSGEAIRDYFNQTPLKASLGTTLTQLEIGGDVTGNLHLDIPLTGAPTTASGAVALDNNTLTVHPLGTELKQLTGHFRYSNGNLQSDSLKASWFGQPVSVIFNTAEKADAFDVLVNMEGNWALNRLTGIPNDISRQVSGQIPWSSDIAVTLPFNGKTHYQVDVKGDLKNVSSHLPSPLNKAGGQPMPVQLNAKGDLQAFVLSGKVGKASAFNSQWLLGKQVALARGAWTSSSNRIPALPQDKSLTLSLPALDGEQWLALMTPLSGQGGKQLASRLRLPDTLALMTPSLNLGGQQWHQLSLERKATLSGSVVKAQGKEINASLTMADHAPWRADIDYLYYNPQSAEAKKTATQKAADPFNVSDPSLSFSAWPALQLRCRECWILGQNLGRVEGDIAPVRDQLLLSHGLVDTGKSRLTVEGGWTRNRSQNRTSLKGVLSGANIGEATDYVGIATPLRDAPFKLDYDLHWQDAPWQPDLATLSGVLHADLGKGKINNISSGSAGRLLRLVSFDALLRKLQFDFRDTFGKGFYFDSIKGSAWLKEGTLHTNDLLIDGLEADIAMSGEVNFKAQTIDMEAVIAPEISATVGVATAFAINPVVGAAVFAASKVLAPLWNKLSVIRYHISGELEKPTINEVLRESRRPDGKR